MSDTSLPRSTPEAQGMPSQALQAFLDSLDSPEFQVHSFMLLRHGHVMAEAFWQPYDASCRRYLYSLSKSFTSTAIGFAVQEGLLTVDDRVIDLLPEDAPADPGPNLAAMRVRHLLSMTTGHAGDATAMILPDGLVNWARSILSAPVDFEPGTHFVYNSAATYLLSCIVQRLAGQTVLEYLAPRLFEPLGISGATWGTCPRGINEGGWGLSLHTEDLARFGQLYLQKGRWEGRQLLSAAWVEQATSRQVDNGMGERQKEPSDWRQGYGYQFWRCQHNAYRGDGAYGQYCIVMPEQDAVLVLTSEAANMQAILDRVWQHLLPAMGEGFLPPQKRLYNDLCDRMSRLRIAFPASLQPGPGLEKLSGARLSVQENPFGVQAFSLASEPRSITIHLWDGDGEYEFKAGLDAWQENLTWLPFMQTNMISMLLRRVDRSPLRLAAYARWQDPQTLVVTLQYLPTPHSNTLTFTFTDAEVHLKVTGSLSDPNNPFLANTDKEFTAVLQSTPVA